MSDTIIGRRFNYNKGTFQVMRYKHTIYPLFDSKCQNVYECIHISKKNPLPPLFFTLKEINEGLINN